MNLELHKRALVYWWNDSLKYAALLVGGLVAEVVILVGGMRLVGPWAFLAIPIMLLGVGYYFAYIHERDKAPKL